MSNDDDDERGWNAVEYEQAVKQQLLKTLHAYQDPDGTVDMAGWLADTARAFDVAGPGAGWRDWADEVIGLLGVTRGGASKNWLSTVRCVVSWQCPCGAQHLNNPLTQPAPTCACGNVFHISFQDGLNIGYDPPAPAPVPAQVGPTLWGGNSQ